MAKYDVHTYVTVRVKVSGIEATSMEEAVKTAAKTDFDGLFNGDRVGCGSLIHTEYADEITGYLVDEEGDTEYERSKSFNADGSERKDS